MLQPGEVCDDGNLVSGDGCSATCTSECGTVAWAQSEPGTAGRDDAIDVAVDSAGNLYLLISIPAIGSNTYGPTLITQSDSGPDTVVWSLTASGTHRWVAQAGGEGWAQPQQIAVDAAGNVYVTGILLGLPVTFGSTMLMPVGGRDVFVWSLTSSGAHRWAVRGGGSSDDYGSAIDVGSGGTVYVGGQFSTSAAFGGVNLSGVNSEAFVWSLNGASGATRWAVSGGGAFFDGALGLAVADDGAGTERVVATGSFGSGSATFGSTVLTSAGSSDLFVWALAPADGATQWAVRGGSPGNEGGEDVAADAVGNVYVLAYSEGAGTYGSTSPPLAGGRDAVVWSLDLDGGSRWATSAGGTNTEVPAAIAVSGGSAYVTGHFFSTTAAFGAATIEGNGTSQIFVATASTSDGTWTCARAFGGTGSETAAGIVVSAGSVFTTGSSTSNPLQIGAFSLNATSDAVIFRMDP
jgi:cysteine-rich repeat protein